MNRVHAAPNTVLALTFAVRRLYLIAERPPSAVSGTRMVQIGDLTGLTLCFLAVVAIGFTLAAAIAVVPGQVAAQPARRSRAPVTLLKPLHLAEPGLEENLRSFLRQD